MSILRGLPVAIACAALSAAAACGGFENGRFVKGEGGVAGRTDALARVWVVGRADLATSAGDEGAFLVSGAPAGRQRLLLGTGKAAGVQDVTVVAGRTADAGAIALPPAGLLTGRAPAGALVYVPGTALVAVAREDGRFVLPGVPADGCVPVVAAGSAPVEACAGDGSEVDLSDAPPARECRGLLDCPVGLPCDAGVCRLPAGDDTAPDAGEPGAEAPDGPGPDDEVPAPDGPACDDARVGDPCGPPGLCGEGGVLGCGPDGGLVCSTTPPGEVVEGCDGFGQVWAVTELSLAGAQGYDLDNGDGDGDPTTGRDNALSLVGPLLDLIDRALRAALDLEDGARAAYLLDLRDSRLRVYVGVASPDDPDAYVPRWSPLAAEGGGGDGLPLGDLPTRSIDAASGDVLAGPAPLSLHIDTVGGRHPLPLARAYVGLDLQGGVGQIGGAVDLSRLLAFIDDARLRAFLTTVLSPGDIDADGDGQDDALSLALALSVRPVTLRVP